MQLKRLGPYEIGKPLGKGGMGSVYAAVDMQTGQRVAIKALSPYLATAEGFRERFEAEIESLKTLRHEGIVRLYGYGEQDGVLFYSMELVEGVSLEDEIRAGRRFNWPEVSNIAIQLSHALKHAHDHGIIHRDIKPANALLYNEDRVKLADFGIARLFGNTQLTTAGGVLGTADYMSPEQADGRPVTARCDQYSLGGVMYTLLAGRPPFQAKNLPQMLQLQRFAKPEPVRRYAPDAPEQLERVIMQLLSKNPADRFPNTQVLARHLQAMVMALSRPAADDFALGAEPLAADAPHALAHSLGTEETRLEEHPSDAGNGRRPDSSVAQVEQLSSSHDAATLATDAVPASPPAKNSAATQPNRTAVATGRETLVRPARFTTLEEEEARRRAEGRRSWVVVAMQFAALVAVLAAMAATAVQLSRPPSADRLYKTIKAQGIGSDDASLASVEREIAEFLRRFPNDARAAELTKYQQQIGLDRADRRLRQDSRDRDAKSSPLLPVEQLYVDAIDSAARSPDVALARLQSLIDLYDTPVAAANTHVEAAAASNKTLLTPADRTAIVVQLAERQLIELRARVEQQEASQRAALEERLATAQRLASSNAAQAKTMYRAIIALYQHEPWAQSAVATARERLAELDGTQE